MEMTIAAPTKPILILGTTPFATEVADWVSEIPGFQIAGFVENMNPERRGETLEGMRVFWVDELDKMTDSHLAVCALGTTHRSKYVDQVAAKGMGFATLAHPTVRISAKSTLSEGDLITVGAIIGAYTRIGRHVLVNRVATIGHHVEVGDYCTIGPGTHIAGSCRIGEGTYIGIGAIVIDHITIGSHSVVGAGAVVIEDVPDNVLVVGVPAKIVKENIEGK